MFAVGVGYATVFEASLGYMWDRELFPRLSLTHPVVSIISIFDFAFSSCETMSWVDENGYYREYKSH